MKWNLLLISICAVLAGCKEGPRSSVLLIGLDTDNRPVEALVSQKEYGRRLKATVESVGGSVFPALQHHDENPFKRPFILRTVIVGVGISAEAGVGPFKVAAVPKFTVGFTNSTNPFLP